ncbi:MAG: hypothetical protein D3904_03405, partial [Candidatus Electrothrix sp. EH2]|nr:hypothetical protein [Candidatus Electrothrix sp. EH2]
EPLAARQAVYHGSSDYFDMQAIIEKPENMDLQAFLDSPKTIADTLLAAVPYFRYIGADKVLVNSLGEPVNKEIWQDKLGRTWRSAFWYVPYADYFFSAHCLPYPNGAICNILDKSTDILGLDHFATVQEGNDELVVGYKGSLEAWEEYLALGENYLPAYFQQAEISHKGDQVDIRLKDFHVTFQHPEITGQSSLRLHLGYANDQLLAEELVMLSLFPRKSRPDYYAIRPYYEPSPFSSDSYIGTWEECISGTGDFSGKKISTGNRVVVQKSMMQTKTTMTAPDAVKIDKIFTIGCTYKASTAEEQDVEQDCERFFQSVQFTDQ